ncbi:MAG: S1/P1 nuclease, partial [Coxiellaceae bacterium]|nr:S1/P1 nuclease [Coxiellaceae bacterium]
DGHRIVAEIAYDNLSPQAKKKVDELTYQADKTYTGRSRFLYISTWADRIRMQDDHRFDSYHYISLPISEHGAPTKSPDKRNVVWAIEKAKHVLADPTATFEEQQLYLKLLVHCVGDVHQPLHAANRFTFATPNGDYGGNRFMIYSAHHQKMSLHCLWDGGLGMFSFYDKRYPIHATKIRKVASNLERRYSHVRFGLTEISKPTIAWAQESHALAQHFVYRAHENGAQGGDYIGRGQLICEQQLALAGYRLAHVLNAIYMGESV